MYLLSESEADKVLGNYYSITNDYDTDARVFFSQGCEISAQAPDQSQNSLMALGY